MRLVKYVPQFKMPKTKKEDSTPQTQESEDTDDTDTEYSQWKKNELPPQKVYKDRRVYQKKDLRYYETMDHMWIRQAPYYIRLGKRPSTLHRVVERHWKEQKKLWKTEPDDA